MTLKLMIDILNELHELQGVGGRRYKAISEVLNREATTYNMEEAAKLLQELK